MDQAPAPAKTTDDHNAPKGLAKFDVLTNPLNPHLQALARLDFQTYIHHIQVSNEGTTRIERLKNPIQTWTETLGEEFGQVKATLRRCRLRRQAEQEIDLDDEGNIDQVRLAWEREGNEAANDKGRSEWYALTQVHIINSTSGSGLT